MRSRVAFAGMVIAVCAAVGGIALVIAAGVGTATAPTAPSPPGSASPEPVTATDFCYVEAMIYYRVEAGDLANAMLGKTGATPDTRDLAERQVAQQAVELDPLRPWFVSWTHSRPRERPTDGPCAGHGNHTQMPGMPTAAQWDQLIAAKGAAAERIFLELLIAQDTAMVDFATKVRAEDPHSRVQDSAEQVIGQGNDGIAALETLLTALP